MQQSFMDILLTDVVVKAVCWTLVHSLWQGLIAALIAGAVIMTTRRSAAVLRYNLLTADLVLFLLAAIGTCSYELRADEGAAPVGAVVVDGVQAVAGKIAMQARYVVGAPTMMERVGVFLNEHAGAVVMVWMACLLMQLVRMTGGLYKVHRLRRHRVFLPTEFWQERMSVLMGRLGIEKKVVLLQSGSVTMPVTFGFLKPSILVPLGMLANLPAEQVETILLHELAHIRRSDYLANLLLHIGEAIFFFNPGVRWVAWLIRQEREACCDDLVLAGTGDRDSYFEALIAFGQYAIGRRSMALPLGSGRSELLWRIRRMLNQENKKLHLMEKTILSFGLMAVLAIGLVSMKGAGRPLMGRGVSGPPVMARTALGAVVDTVPVRTKAPVVVIDTAKVSEMVDSIRISVSSADGAASQLTARHVPAETVATIAGTKLKILIRKDGSYAFVNDPAVSVADQYALATAIAVPHAALGAPMPPMFDFKPYLAAPVAPVTDIKTPGAAAVAPVTNLKTPGAAAVAPVTNLKTPGAAAVAPVTDLKTPVAAVVDPATGIVGPTATTTAGAPVPAVLAPGGGETIKLIVADLMARGFVKKDGSLSFRLDGHSLKVNGVRQPADVFQAFKDKYVGSAKVTFDYSHREGSTRSGVSVSQD